MRQGMSFPQKFRDWASMVRLPNVPTVWSNVFTAWVLAGAGFGSHPQNINFVFAVLGGTLLYVGGTLLNDVSDVAIDRIERPERALPAQRVSVRMVWRTALACLAGGMATFILAGSYMVVILLLGLIVTYDRMHQIFPKQEGIPRVRILIMGLCRCCLALAVGEIVSSQLGHHGWMAPVVVILPAFGIWVAVLFGYICTITWLAQKESASIPRAVVGWMLAALPLVDGIFLAFTRPAVFLVVPLGCFALAVALRRVASAT